MSTLLHVTRQELKSFFDHPTAYILTIAFLALGFFLSFRSLYASSVATLRPFFDLLPLLFGVFVPALTMRTLAEERRSRTLEWLLAHPLDEARVVGGKFLGNWIFVLIALACTLPMAIGVVLASDADPGTVVAQYVGAALLAALTVAIGVWASSVTRNQITAFIVATAVTLTLFLIGLPVVRIGLPPGISQVAGQLSLVSHFENVARGVIDLRDVLYFVSGSALFLVLAMTAIGRTRLSPSGEGWRRLRLGAWITAGLVLALNLLGGFIHGRVDLTGDRLYTLSDGTREILGAADDLVTVKLFLSRELPPEVQFTARDVRDLLADMRRAGGGNLVVEEFDPDRDEDAAEEARSLGISPIEFNVLRDQEFQVRRGWFGLAMLYTDQREVIPVIDRTDDLEFRLASALSTMTRERTPRIGWITGFGARGPFEFGGLQRALSERYDVQPIDMAGDTALPGVLDSVDVVVVASPGEPLGDTTVARLAGFVDRGGSALLMLESVQISPQAPMTMPVATGLDAFLADRGLRLRSGPVYDLRSSERISAGQRGMFQLVQSYPFWPVVFPTADGHATTRDLNSLTLGWASALDVLDSTRVTPLWTTTDAGGVQPAGGSIAPDVALEPDPSSLSSLVVAAAVAPADDAGGRVLVLGDANLVEDQFMGANPQNLLFVANAVDWLSQDEALIAIRAKNRTPPPLVFSSDARRAFLKWGCLVGIPLLVAAFGLLRVGGRRSRAERAWGLYAEGAGA